MTVAGTFKIRAAFVKNKYNSYFRQSAGHRFLQLTKEFPGRMNPEPVVVETFYAFPVSEEVQASCPLLSESLLSPSPKSRLPREWKVYCFKGETGRSPPSLPKPDATHILFEETPSFSNSWTYTLEDCNALVKNRWEMAKWRCKSGEKLTLSVDCPESVVLDDNIRNEVYKWLALMMDCEPHKFQARALSYNKPTPPLPKGSPRAKTEFWIKAAVAHKPVRIGQRNLNLSPIKIGHYFWILTKFDHSNEVDVDSIHGFTTSFEIDTYGNISPRILGCKNTRKSKLKVFAVPYPRYPSQDAAEATLQWVVPDKTEIVYGNSPQQADGMDRWSRAKWFIGELNRKETRSSSYGAAQGLRLDQCRNSYLAFATLAVFLGIKTHKFNGYLSFGTKNLIIPEEEIMGWIDSYSQVEPRAKIEER